MSFLWYVLQVAALENQAVTLGSGQGYPWPVSAAWSAGLTKPLTMSQTCHPALLTVKCVEG